MRYHSSLLTFLLASCLVSVFAAPTTSTPEAKPTAYNHGDIVGVRANKIEDKDPSVKNYKDIDIHPGVVVAGPDADGKYKVATISKKHLHDPPQTDVASFHPGSGLNGKIKLVATKPVEVGDMKPWKSKTTGTTMEPMSESNLQKLHEAMAPHVGWKAPEQPPVASSSTPAQSARKPTGNRAIPGQVHANGPKNHPIPGANKHISGPHPRPHIPIGKKAHHVDVHATGSKHSAPVLHARPHSPAGKKAHPPHAHVAPPRHGGAPGSKVRNAPRPQVAKANNKVIKPVLNQSAIRGRKGPGMKRSLRSW